MSDSYTIKDQNNMYFVTFTIVDWIDLFTRVEFKHVVVNSLKYCQTSKGLVIYAWCLMPSHMHMIARAKDKITLPEIIRDFKKFTNKEIIRLISEIPDSRKDWLLYRFEYAGKFMARIKNYKVWKDGYHAKELVSNSFIDQKLDYIHNNPVVDEIVDEPHHYKYSSASNYAGQGGLIDVEILE